MIKNCQICQKEFTPTKYNPYQVFCSSNCAATSSYRNKKNDPKFIERKKLSVLKWKKNNPKKYKEISKKMNQAQTDKRRDDPEYRKYLLNLQKNWRANNPDKLKKIYEKDNRRKRERYKTDLKHREDKKTKTKKYHRENPEVDKKSYQKVKNDPVRWKLRLIKGEEWRKKNWEKIYKRQRAYELKHNDRYKKMRAEWRKENPEKMKKSIKKYTSSPHGRAKMNAYRRNKMKTDPQFRMASNIRLRLWEYIIKQKGRKSAKMKELLGCSWDFFAGYIEKKFTKGMNWDNYGEWHVDHIIPLSSFDLSKNENQKIAAHYANLQPLWAKDNLKKGAKILK